MEALKLQLSTTEMTELRAAAEREGVSVEDFVRRAVTERASDRSARLRAAIATVATEDAELLERLGR